MQSDSDGYPRIGATEDILDCRTAALGGQVWRCEGCNTEVFSYHSCVMGKFSNGESAMASHRIPAVLSTDGAASHPYLVPISPDLPGATVDLAASSQ
jgi:hypothetical protein